jgi:RNA polymerase sigma factor (sigma-70 family)
MSARLITHEQLDRRLDTLAKHPKRFTENAKKLAAELDAKGLHLEISDPETWRHGSDPMREPSRITFENQLRTEIDRLTIMGREDEMRLARRIEFARVRLDLALSEAGLGGADLAAGVPHLPSVYLGMPSGSCSLPPKVCRAWMEWHALRLEMVERNLYLALINVERYAHTTVGRADLIQEGAASLFRAVDGFDWRRGLLFRTYAVHWLNQAFRSYLYNFGARCACRSTSRRRRSTSGRRSSASGDPDASPRRSRASPASRATRHLGALAVRTTRSLDAPIGDPEDSSSLRDVLTSHDERGPVLDAARGRLARAGLDEALGKLSERERFVVGCASGSAASGAHARRGREAARSQPRARAADPGARDLEAAHAAAPARGGSLPELKIRYLVPFLRRHYSKCRRYASGTRVRRSSFPRRYPSRWPRPTRTSCARAWS